MTLAEASKPVLEFKGRMMTLTILRLMSPSVEALARELDRRVQEAPTFFRHLPVILDVADVAETDLHMDLPGFVALLRNRDLMPVAIRGGGARWAEAAEAAGLPVYAPEREPPEQVQIRADDEGSGKQQSTAGSGGGLLVTQPVRSGQQIYARGTDLVILAPVSPGAEVLADGHIHVYGSLGGRALAGVLGDADARIFCKSFRAELVSVAGVYSVSEQFDEALAGHPAQVSLDGDTLQIERL